MNGNVTGENRIAEVQGRDYLFDNIKALLIFTVAFVHMMMVFGRECDFSYQYMIFPLTVICAFHMPLFIFTSGYFSKKVQNSVKSAANIAVTYIIAQSFFMVYYMIVSGHAFSVREWLTPRYSMWYIFALVLMKLLLPVFSKSRKWLMILIPVSMFFVFHEPDDKLIKSLLKFAVYTSFFMIGYFTDKRIIDRIRAVPRKYHALLFAACAGSLVFIRLAFHVKFYIMRLMMLHEISVRHFPSIPAGLAFTVYMYILAVLFSVSVIGLMPDRKLRMSHIGKNTLPVYITQATAVLVTAKIIRVTGVTVGEPAATAISLVVAAFIVIFFGSDRVAGIMNKIFYPRPFR